MDLTHLSSPLFTEFEERPKGCQAVCLTSENVDRLADYFSDHYTTEVHRRGGVTSLVIRSEHDQSPFELVVHLGEVIVYAHPPKVVPQDEFRAQWRGAR